MGDGGIIGTLEELGPHGATGELKPPGELGATGTLEALGAPGALGELEPLEVTGVLRALEELGALETLGVLYESDEWSDHKLAAELQRALGDRATVRLVNMEADDALDQALACDLLVSRVFASAGFRGHQASLDRMEMLIPLAQQAGIPLVNPGRAHGFEVSKHAATEALAQAGITVPRVYALGLPSELLGLLDASAAPAGTPSSPAVTVLSAGSAPNPSPDPTPGPGRPPAPAPLPYPCIIKPDRGGRTTHTDILHDAAQARAFLEDAPDIPFIVEEYVAPERGFMTRIEIVAGQPRLVVKRSIAQNGLSAYRFGSTYELYPECPTALLDQAARAARALGFFFGSFDVIETGRGAFFIDANSVSNVSEDCTELFQMDLMACYARALASAIKGKGI